jgi:hypothetical protein
MHLSYLMNLFLLHVHVIRMPATVTFTFVHPILDEGESDFVLPATTSIDTLKGLFGDIIGKDASTISLQLSLVATVTSDGVGKQSALAVLRKQEKHNNRQRWPAEAN